MKMKKGDRAFFYHSNEGKNIVGIVEIAREHHPDPTAEAGEPWVVVDVKALEPVPKPVSLEDIKKEPKLKDMALIKLSRLSVQPVTADEWKLVCKMGGVKACSARQHGGDRVGKHASAEHDVLVRGVLSPVMADAVDARHEQHRGRHHARHVLRVVAGA